MIERLTLLKDIPEAEAGYTLLVKGKQVSEDGGATWFTPCGRSARLRDLRSREAWCRVEQVPEIPDDRPHLSEIVKRPLYTLEEALDVLGWQYDETEDGADNIRCCGESVTLGGILTAEYGHCKRCEKRLQDMTAFLPAGHSSVGLIDDDKYQADDGRRWAVELQERHAEVGQ